MLVGERMSKHPVTVNENVAVDEALNLMRKEKVRRLPVLDDKGKLVGIVSEKDLLYASPSPVTTLSIYELHYLVSKIKVHDVMTKEMLTVTEYTPLEEAARIMADNKIGGLPVMRDSRLVGIITETDLFKIFLELLGARESGLRLTMLVPEAKGILAGISKEIASLNGNIVSLGTFLGDDPTDRLLAMKVTGVDKDELVKALQVQDLVLEFIDIRET